MVFKQDLKVASEDVERRSGSRNLRTKGTAMENAHDAK